MDVNTLGPLESLDLMAKRNLMLFALVVLPPGVCGKRLVVEEIECHFQNTLRGKQKRQADRYGGRQALGYSSMLYVEFHASKCPRKPIVPRTFMITDGPEAADLHEVLNHADAVLARAFFWSNPLVVKKHRSYGYPIASIFSKWGAKELDFPTSAPKEYALPIFDQLEHPMVFCNFFEADDEGFLKRPRQKRHNLVNMKHAICWHACTLHVYIYIYTRIYVRRCTHMYAYTYIYIAQRLVVPPSPPRW